MAINLLPLLYFHLCQSWSYCSIIARIFCDAYHLIFFVFCWSNYIFYEGAFVVRCRWRLACKQHNVGALVTNFNEGKYVSTNMLGVSLGGMLGGCLLFVIASNFFADRTCLFLISFFYKMKFIFISMQFPVPYLSLPRLIQVLHTQRSVSGYICLLTCYWSLIVSAF